MVAKFSLGNVTFDTFEVPEQFEDTRETAYDVKDQPGGGRTLTMFGVHDAPLSWSGWFWGASARDRLQALKQMQDQCQPVLWTYGSESWEVAIIAVRGGRRHQNKIRYGIEIEILENKAQVLPQAAPDPDAQIKQGLDAATAAVNAPQNSGIFPGLAATEAFNTWAAAMDAAFPWTSVSLEAATGLIAQALGVEDGFEAIAGSLRDAETLDDMNSLIDAESALGGVRLARINLANYFGAAALPQLVANTSVWDLAAQKFGDVAAGLDIMGANGLADPVITEPVSLVLPPEANA